MSRQFPIAWRLAAMFSVTAALVFTCVALYLYCMLVTSVREQINGELEFHHAMVDPVLQSRETPEEWNLVRRKLDAMTEGGRIRYWVASDDARFLYGTPVIPPEKHALADNLFSFANTGTPPVTWGVLSRHLPARGDRPDINFVVALDASSYLQAKESFTEVMWAASGLGILVVALLGYWIARLGLRPVHRLTEEANGLPPNAPRERLGVDALPPEIGQLAMSFNNALARRETAWLQLEAFNADVAHELRTPLTNLIGQTQVALSQRRDPQDLRELLLSNLEELERMSSIVNDMLFLSCAENGSRASELAEISLRIETNKTVEYLEASFSERALSVRVRGDARVQADKRLFHRALANLLANSARYASSNSCVTVDIERGPQSVRVSVSNAGSQIPIQNLGNLFDRFYRGDASRSHSGVHHGLGLSIVRAIASMHGGTVFATSEEGVNTFGFTLSRSLKRDGA
ncbi:heavy metal sensor histidine kinase [Achromobacter piechaudii]|uniref:Sensor protein n=1 Tax=Achromobacter piechaudii TaxID=72556 RepID=A0A6S7CXN3_9BURK|nr:heavy metal sensor histidine kinase [Achromobacter piechaudii]CAB3868659.1 Adaptive-response sensory-kinase SasA [Achromobacter piechaudii]